MNVPIVDLKDKIPEKTMNMVNDVIRSGYWVDGPQVHALENDFAQYCDTKYCRALCNGTTALMSLMATLNLTKDDEVIVPSFTFIATANSVLFSGAKVVFADVDPNTFTLDPKDIKNKITDKTKVIMPVHLFGLCANMEEINKIAKKDDIVVIEDAAQAHGATINGKKAGSFGYGSGFSLYPTKNMFAGGEGGLITTNDEDYYRKINLFMNHGQAEKYYHTTIGYNFRLAEINGVLARYSLECIDVWNTQRAENARLLSSLLNDIEDIQTPITPEGFTHVYHQYTLKIKNGKRDSLIKALQKNNIGHGIHYAIPIHKQPYYQSIGYKKTTLPITESLCKEVLSLPIHPEINEEQIKYMSNIIHENFKIS